MTSLAEPSSSPNYSGQVSPFPVPRLSASSSPLPCCPKSTKPTPSPRRSPYTFASAHFPVLPHTSSNLSFRPIDLQYLQQQQHPQPCIARTRCASRAPLRRCNSKTRRRPRRRQSLAASLARPTSVRDCRLAPSPSREIRACLEISVAVMEKHSRLPGTRNNSAGQE